ncbi:MULTISPECIES: alginate export family protein [Kordiimonas]|jgi:archaellin|uniref:Alginate export n=1 Tax=Kordiimonas lacus TaxID=637679 RepID=A0A1G7AC84_9PROT|nr:MULTISPECIES: alginate export family protein [Kordiimonas]SDE11486.1 Alginate export [Kordiimonas lacus]
MKKSPLLIAVSSFAIAASGAAAAEDTGNFLQDGDAGLDLRYRLELVDQDGFSKKATASTLLTKIWYRTGDLHGFSAYIEGTNTTHVGQDTFNDTVNGNITRPVVADPDTTELNQAYIQYKNEYVTLKGGRQGINLGNQRFVGTVGFRQNDQTYDAVAAIATPAKDLTAVYGYVWNVNRIFGEDHPLGDLDTNTHVFNLGYKGFEFANITAYAYLIDLNDAPVLGLSSSTFGVRLDGKQTVSDGLKVGYELEYASQSDYKDNPNDFSADYWRGSLSATAGSVTGQVGYELLGSDNGVAFQTPLATLHAFNGWADKFLGTPANGLEDVFVSVAYKVPGDGAFGGTLFKAVYHDFSSDTGGISYGSEIDFLVSKKINKYLTASVKAAFYNADSFSADTDKIWFTLQAKF